MIYEDSVVRLATRPGASRNKSAMSFSTCRRIQESLYLVIVCHDRDTIHESDNRAFASIYI